MTTRSIGILAVVTAVTVSLGVMYSQKRESATAAAARDQVLVPELAQRINDVAQLKIESAEGSFTIALKENRWGLVDIDGQKRMGKQENGHRRSRLASLGVSLVDPRRDQLWFPMRTQSQGDSRITEEAIIRH